MLYCVKCTLMLDEEARFCPECNEEDPNWQEQEIPNIVISSHAFEPGVFEKLRQVNQHIEAQVEAQAEAQTDEYDSDSEGFPGALPIPPEDKPGNGLFVMMMLLSTCLSIVGLVMGIIYIMDENRHYQFMGTLMLVISGIFMVFGTIFIFTIIFISTL